MAISQTKTETEAVDLSAESFDTFCEDMSGMFGVEMECSEEEPSEETAKSLEKRFKKLAAVISVKTEGLLDGTFHVVLDQEGLFTLAGIIVMLPERIILENRERGSAEEAEGMSDAVGEAGNLLVGTWDRVFREGLEGHGHLSQSGTFIGAWGKAGKSIGLGRSDKLLYVPYKMTIGSYPTFDCGVIWPRSLFECIPEDEPEEEPVDEEAKKEEEAAAEAKKKEEATAKARKIKEDAAKARKEKEAEAEAKKEEEAEAEAKKEEEAEAEAKKEEAVAEPKEEEEPAAEAKEEEKPAAEAKEEEKPAAEAKEEEEAVAEAKEEESESQEAAVAQEDSEKTEQVEEETAAVNETGEDEAVAEDKESSEDQEDEAVEQAKKEATDAGDSDNVEDSSEGSVSETIRRMTESSAELPGEVSSQFLKVTASEIMEKDVVWGKGDDSVEEALSRMQQGDAGYMMIGREGVLEGLVSKSDIAGAVSVYLRPVFAKWHRPLDDATLKIKVKWIMSRPVHVIKGETSLYSIIDNMRQSSQRAFPVVDADGKVEGLVTVFDIFAAIMKVGGDVSSVGKTAQSPALV